MFVDFGLCYLVVVMMAEYKGGNGKKLWEVKLLHKVICLLEWCWFKEYFEII